MKLLKDLAGLASLTGMIGAAFHSMWACLAGDMADALPLLGLAVIGIVLVIICWAEN